MVSVQGDSGTGGNNLSIHLYIQDTQGNVIKESILWDPVIASGNRWLPSVVGIENGFWIAAATATETHFRTAVQPLDIDGNPREEARWVGPDSYAVYPNIDAKGDSYIVGWENAEDEVQYVKGSLEGVAEDGVQTLEGHANVRVLWDNNSDSVFTHQRNPLRVQENENDISIWQIHTIPMLLKVSVRRFLHTIDCRVVPRMISTMAFGTQMNN